MSTVSGSRGPKVGAATTLEASAAMKDVERMVLSPTMIAVQCRGWSFELINRAERKKVEIVPTYTVRRYSCASSIGSNVLIPARQDRTGLRYSEIVLQY